MDYSDLQDMLISEEYCLYNADIRPGINKHIYNRVTTTIDKSIVSDIKPITDDQLKEIINGHEHTDEFQQAVIAMKRVKVAIQNEKDKKSGYCRDLRNNLN